MFRRLIARIDQWAAAYEGTIIEVFQVWYDGHPVLIYVPSRRVFANPFKRLWLRVRNGN